MLALVLAAFGQTPTIAPLTEVVYITGDAPVAGRRFADQKVVGSTTLKVGERVRVLFREDGWVRVRTGDTYLWVPAEATSPTPPEGTLSLGGLENLQLPEGFELPEGMQLK